MNYCTIKSKEIELPPQINEEVACFCQHLAELREGAENGVLTVKVGILPS